jgi:hypothetical protein
VEAQPRSKRHRWEATHNHFYPGPKYWKCIHCGLSKRTEWEEKPVYTMRERIWYRFAPPCPPPDVGGHLDEVQAIRAANKEATRAKEPG